MTVSLEEVHQRSQICNIHNLIVSHLKRVDEERATFWSSSSCSACQAENFLLFDFFCSNNDWRIASLLYNIPSGVHTGSCIRDTCTMVHHLMSGNWQYQRCIAQHIRLVPTAFTMPAQCKCFQARLNIDVPLRLSASICSRRNFQQRPVQKCIKIPEFLRGTAFVIGMLRTISISVMGDMFRQAFKRLKATFPSLSFTVPYPWPLLSLYVRPSAPMTPAFLLCLELRPIIYYLVTASPKLRLAEALLI